MKEMLSTNTAGSFEGPPAKEKLYSNTARSVEVVSAKSTSEGDAVDQHLWISRSRIDMFAKRDRFSFVHTYTHLSRCLISYMYT